MPTVVRRLTALVATPRLGDPSAALLAILGDLCARFGWRRGESTLYRLARRVEFRTGARLAAAGRDALIAAGDGFVIELARDILGRVMKTQYEFTCTNCGHVATEPLWLCPRCNKLDTFNA